MENTETIERKSGAAVLVQRVVKRLVGWIKDKTRRCSHEGCWAKGRDCYLPENTTGVPDEWVCGEHAHAAGYCPSCGFFWAGIESFDFGKSGLCENCEDEWKTETGEYDEEWEGPYYDPYQDA